MLEMKFGDEHLIFTWQTMSVICKCKQILIVLKVQSWCKLYNNKYMNALKQIPDTEIFAFTAVVVLSYWAVKFCL